MKIDQEQFEAIRKALVNLVGKSWGYKLPQEMVEELRKNGVFAQYHCDLHFYLRRIKVQ